MKGNLILGGSIHAYLAFIHFFQRDSIGMKKSEAICQENINAA